MWPRRRTEIGDLVVVIVGASSGIGRATAHQCARRGASLVLAARTTDALCDVARECAAVGGDARIVTADVSDAGATEHILSVALDAFGRVDAWVDLAAGLIAGPFGRESDEEVEQLVRTNVLGTIRSSRVALEYFRAQGHGTLINVASMLGVVVNPRVPLYTMTKFAIRGLTLSLYYANRGTGVDVALVLPGPVDTPLFQRAANHTGRALRAIPPAIAPERVAAVIVRRLEHPRRQTSVGWSSHLIGLGLRVVPGVTEWAVARYSAATIVRSELAADASGALCKPAPPTAVDGGWRRGRLRRAIGSRRAGMAQT